MIGGCAAVVLAIVAALPAGCAVLLDPSQAPVDEPAPLTIRAAVEPARRALLAEWPRSEAVAFRFLEARCGLGARAVLVFEQRVPGVPESLALALTHDVAAGIISGAWWERYDVADPDADPELQRILGGREIACP